MGTTDANKQFRSEKESKSTMGPQRSKGTDANTKAKGTDATISIKNIDERAAAALSGQSCLLTRTWSTGSAKIFQSNPSKTKDSTHGGALEQNYSKQLPTAANPAEKSIQNQPTSNKSNMAPILLTNIQFIQGIPLKARPLLTLLDSGSTTTLINKRALPFGTIPIRSKHKVITTTASGSFNTTEYVIMKNIKLQEFGNCTIDKQQARLFNSPNCRYDLILGRNFLHLAKINLLFESATVQWMNWTVPMKDISIYQSNKDYQGLNNDGRN